MQVAAFPAAPGAVGDHAFLALLLRRQGHAEDLVTRTLVIDDRTRSKLADPDKARSLDVVAFAAPGDARDVGGKRESREGVAGQESFGCKVAVGVEVGLEIVGVLIAEQVERNAG